MFRLVLLYLLTALPAQAEEVVAGMSQNRIAITANFDGSEILIFGAIKREIPIPEGAPLGVIVTVSGPEQPVMVRRKSKVAAIWINTEAVEVDAAPSFYAVNTSGPLTRILSDTEDLRWRISVRRMIRSVGAPSNVENSKDFTEALIRIRQKKDLYQLNENTIELDDQTLFQTSVALPANLVEGAYRTRFFLTRGGKVLSSHSTTIDVQKVGLERWIYNLAHERPLIYGLFSLFIAIVAGWSASAVFRYIRS